MSDTKAPVFQGAATSTDGKKIMLAYDEVLLGTKMAPAGAFTVKVAGAVAKLKAAVVKDSIVELTLTEAVRNYQSVTLGYKAPKVNAATTNTAVQDIAGNDALLLAVDTPVVNRSTLDGVEPVFQSAVTSEDGRKIILSYDEILSTKTAVASAFAVKLDGVATKIRSVVVSANTVELTLGSIVRDGQGVTVAYKPPKLSMATTNAAIQDVIGNDALLLAKATPVTNKSMLDGFGPVFQNASVSADGKKILLNYDEPLCTKTAAASAFAVKVDGVSAKIKAAIVKDSAVELTLISAVKDEQLVTVGYKPPKPSTLTTNAAIQDIAGNDALLLPLDTPVAVSQGGGTVTESIVSILDNVTNLDVTSNIVLNYAESVTPVAGKYIHIVNDGGAGFHGEASASSLDILVTDTSQVAISAGRVTINPNVDLDLANNYHVSIDAGAFIGQTSQQSSSVFDGTTALNFSTVTPGVDALTHAAASQSMDSTGALIVGKKWLDIEGIGNPASLTGTPLDLSGGDYVLVAKDYDDKGGNLAYDGIKVNDFYVSANQFGAGDLIYIDNQFSALNDFFGLSIINYGRPPTTIQFAGNGNEGLGGFIDITLVGSSVSTFDSLSEMQKLLGIDYSPIISA